MTDPTPPQAYQDSDLVYVDPETRTVIGRVEWSKNEQPMSKAYQKQADGKKDDDRPSWRKTYPWGTYRSMRRIYKIEGKVKDPEPNRTLDQVLPKALSEAYWEW